MTSQAPSAALSIAVELPDIRLGLVEAEGVRVAPAGLDLAAEMDVVCERLRRELTIERVAELESIRSVRATFRAWGVDPARYRPSAEALLRRTVQGKGLYRISNVVDVNNLGSIETGWPYGSYDRALIEAPAALRLGTAGETYEGIGKQTWHLNGRPVLADRQGPFGSPISDSVRTMVTEAATTVLTVIFAPAASSLAALEESIERHARRLQRFAGAHVRRAAVVEG